MNFGWPLNMRVSRNFVSIMGNLVMITCSALTTLKKRTQVVRQNSHG